MRQKKTAKKVKLTQVRNDSHCLKTHNLQPLSHVFEIYNLFASVNVKVTPTTYQDVPKALEEVREKLVFYNHQTNIIDWYEEYKDFEGMLNINTRKLTCSHPASDVKKCQRVHG